MAVAERRLSQMPWWLWPTVLCGLAPLAAWSWQSLFTEVTNARLPTAAHQALALVVWVIALSDRLLDSKRRATWRHWFAGRYRLPLSLLLGVALVVCSRILFWYLPQVILTMGIFLGVPVLFYLFFARLDIGPRAALPREIVRGALFSAGVLLPTYAMANVPPAALQLMISQTLLVSLIFLNSTCREHIDRPEEAQHREDWEAIDSRLGVWLFLLFGTILWLARVESKQPGNAMMAYYTMMGAVTLISLGLYAMRKRISADTLHTLSWLTLTLPLIGRFLIKA